MAWQSRPAEPSAFHAFERAGWESIPRAYQDAFGTLTTQAVSPLLDAARVGPGIRVLDVATGPGYVAAAAAQRGAAVVGIDFSAAMLAEARRHHPEIDFQAGNAEALPVPRRELRCGRHELRAPASRAPGPGAGRGAPRAAPGGRDRLHGLGPTRRVGRIRHRAPRRRAPRAPRRALAARARPSSASAIRRSPAGSCSGWASRRRRSWSVPQVWMARVGRRPLRGDAGRHGQDGRAPAGADAGGAGARSAPRSGRRSCPTGAGGGDRAADARRPRLRRQAAEASARTRQPASRRTTSSRW